LSVSDLKSAIMADKELAEDWPSWAVYHEWYCHPANGGVPNHPRDDRWPVILSSANAETLQDGWHRFHCYVQQRACDVPAVFFLQARHLG
jgi:hypothetical protein